MRTRRSPRNQMILWRALGGPVERPAPFTRAERIDNLRAAIAACLNRRTRAQLERDLAKMERER